MQGSVLVYMVQPVSSSRGKRREARVIRLHSAWPVASRPVTTVFPASSSTVAFGADEDDAERVVALGAGRDRDADGAAEEGFVVVGWHGPPFLDGSAGYRT